MTDLERRLAFLVEADRLKSVMRDTTLTDGSRRENAAEHSWHLALWALVFEDRVRGRGADPDRVVAMLLLHDLALIDAGDAEAARRLFSLLPEPQAAAFHALWTEVAAGETADAAAARAIDIAQPLFQELYQPSLSATDRDVLEAILTTGPAAALAADWPGLHARATALLAGAAPQPSPDLDRRLGFLVEADRLKTVLRGTPLCDGSRRENSAEHSWHVALFALTLAAHAARPVDAARAVRMLVLHDLVEIDAGDAPIHGDHDAAAIALEERRAADRLFGLLPAARGRTLGALWDEFEAGETADAVFARSVDRTQPVLSNLESGGGTWPAYRVTLDQLEARVGAKVRRGAPALWAALEPRIAAWFSARGEAP